jgi:acetate---CoA ligase (ADP-forming)
MIAELKSLALLKGVRGQPPSDLAALADLVAAVSQLPFRYPQVAELDLNPVFVYAKGVCVGDVRVIVSE